MDNITAVPEVHSSQRQFSAGSALVVKLLDPKIMSGPEMNDLWRKVSTQDYSFDDNTRGDPRAFVLNLVAPASYHFLVNDSAYVVVRNVFRDSDASIHFVLWDRSFSFHNIIEAGRQVLEWLFKEQHVHRVSGFIPKFNTLATRFASQMGFKYEGTLRKSLKFHDEFHDVDIYGILEKEFERRFNNDKVPTSALV